ncbi:trifunctional serine/threonine-protein kinase/ATP-binding protein/sensor histidine kinase [Pseudomonas sp. X10]
MTSTSLGKELQIAWNDGERIVCREQRSHQHGSDRVLVVRPAIIRAGSANIDRLAHEFSLKDELDDAWALCPLALLRESGRTALVYKDPGGEPLSCLLGTPMQTSAFLHLAADIAAALGKLHQRGLVHKDLKPDHILVNCNDGHARLGGFGLASRLPRERLSPEPPETIAGTLAYMAPEQTGRMNRSIDSRSDLYALGVTFYQMLTASLPFTAADPMEWVHCHIAKKPVPPSERVATVPAAVSRLVLKLLAKTAEERYQTAAGVEHDLRRCLLDWESHGHIGDFTLDEHSTPDRLLIPEKLYGREREVDTLVAAFERTIRGDAPGLVLVSGYAGIGKSSVVNELHKVLVPSRGLFASGKFDQYKRDIPYSTLVQAFQSLVRPLLGKNDSELASWRDALSEALQPNARLMTDLIPELKLIIGEQPAVPELEPQQAQHRFLQVFRRFIGVFAREEHPLALFLDDLQWLDAATLDLLGDLLTRPGLRHLMLIGAYRDNEVDATHPLRGALQKMRKAGGRIDEVNLAPLARGHIEQLIADALHCEPPHIGPLAELVEDRTAGNPFFVIQFLQALAEEKLLTLDPDARKWQWNPDRIHAKRYTDNVVDLMVGKLIRLPAETRQALQQLACLGNAAEVATLASVLDIPQARVHQVLWDALRQELVERLDGVYAFAHDRIQEAAYLLIPEAQRAEIHLRIGHLFVARTPPEKREEAIFEIVGQLNRGTALIDTPAEREQLAELNLLAGQRAKASTAYSSALAYFTAGAGLLHDACWKSRHDLMFALEAGRAECEFVTGQLLAAEQRLKTLSGRAATTVEGALVACLQVDVYLILDQRENAVAVCLTFLRHVGIDWPPHPDEETVRSEYERIGSLLGERSIDSLIDLPPMQDTVALATIEALTTLFSPALHTDGNLACLTICKAINISLEHGNGDASCVAYANIPRVAGRRFGDYQAGFRFGQLGCELVERRRLERYEARTYLSFSLFVERWARPVRSCHDPLRRVFDIAKRTGDLPFGAFTCNSLISNLLFTGESLVELQSEAEHALAYANTVRFGLVIGFIENQLALIRTLRGLTQTFGCIEEGQSSEADIERRLPMDSPVLACWYWIRKLQARYLAGDHEAAMAAATKAQTLLWTSHSFIEEAEYYFYAALAMAALCDSTPTGERQQCLDTLALHRSELQIWADLCPENFTGQISLVEAEIARLEERVASAERLYEQAIQSAQESGFVHIEALANERAGDFYATRGLGKVARVYLQDARDSYLRWGAEGKVRQLEAKYPLLKTAPPKLDPAATTTITTPVEQLDLATVLKVLQATSGEIVLEKLIDMIMRTAIEQAGAERGLLILSAGNEHRIAAQAELVDRTTRLRLHDAPVSGALLPESVLYHVLRTQESICLDDAVADPFFATDPYIRDQHCRSILCLPLLNQAKLTGALYLENSLTAGVFCPGRISILTLMASQAAISLENARLYRDVAEREAKIRRLVDANIAGIVVWDTDGKIIEANDAFLRMLGYQREDLTSGHMNWRDFTPPELRQDSEHALAQTLLAGHTYPLEKEYIRRDGSRLPVIVGLSMFEANRKEGVAFVLDLTERKLAEQKVRESEQRYREVQAELAHASRVATMGQFVASIAHEVSQPITATLTSAYAARRWLGAQPPELNEVEQLLDSVIKAGNRAADVLGRIRGLIRKAAPQKEPIDVNAAIHEMIDFTRGEAVKCAVSIQTQLADGLPPIEGDPVELQQVLLNLIINAFEAMADVDDEPRQLHIRTVLDEAAWVHVSVMDSGVGFASACTEQIFAPFHTTKSTGLGMGLSICRSIIETHGGRLWASANQPRGAVIQFKLPALPPAQA